LANFSRPYANLIGNPAHQGTIMLLFIGCFMLASGPLANLSVRITQAYVGLLT
jgi:hypothetical protein